MFEEMLFENHDDKLLNEFLDEFYPEILKAIEKEGYNLDFKDFDFFHEINFENHVVGFMSFERFPLAEHQYGIMEVYIIPEYRGNNLLFDRLLQLRLFDNYEFYPRKPTKAFINVLLKNDCAFKLSSNFVLSYFKFMVDVDTEVYKNPKIKRFYKKPLGLPHKANLFDLDLCSVMFRDMELDLIKYSNFFALSEPRKYDLKKYKCRKKLKRVSEKYIDDKFSIWEHKVEEILDFIQRKEEEFAENLLPENVIGSEDKLNNDFICQLEEANLTIDDGFKIREHIVNKLDSGELNDKSYIQRFLYLLRHFEVINKEIGDFDESVEVCPFCGAEIPDFARSCLKCGLYIREIDFDEHAVDVLNENVGKLLEDFKEFCSSSDFFGGVSVEEEDDDELKNLKRFFNLYLTEYEFDEFLDFYNSNDKNLGLEKIRELFLDDKLNKAIGTKEEFDVYYSYLTNYFLYDIMNHDEVGAFIRLIQVSILTSDKFKSKDESFLSSIHAKEIEQSFDVMKITDCSFNVPELFDIAVNTFKIEKYNKNHDIVLNKFKKNFGDKIN